MPESNYSLTTIERHLPTAIDAVEKCVLNGASQVPKVYKGYISSFGAGIVLNGLLPTLAIFSERSGEGNRTEGERVRVLDAIWYILNKKVPDENEKHHPMIREAVEYSKDQMQQRIFVQKITDAAIALKHALRTFTIEE